MTNIEIARVLRKIAAAYTILNENRFKIIAYENAATAVEHATSELKDLWDDNQLDTIPGLGASITGHLDELFKTGKLKHFDQILKKINPAIFSLLEVPGLGPKRAYKLVTELKLKGIDDLEKAAKEHKIAKLETFGEKSELDILENIQRYRHGAIKEKRMVLPEADQIANELIAYLKNFKVDKLGSLRRCVATIGDIDLAIATNESEDAIQAFVDYPKKTALIERGPTGASILLASHRQADMRVSSPESYGAMLQYFTGSKYHNIKLRDFALKKGLSLSEYGINNINKSKSQHPISNNQFPNEQSFYNFLGLDYIPPELREDNGEIEAALKHQLPKLVELKDIKGDLHLHCSWAQETSHDSGESTIGEIREMGETRGYEYVGISDHNPSVSKHNPNQIISEIQARKKEFEQQMYTQGKCRVINLLEVDINPDGKLPLPQEALDLLDGCLVSIHSSFGMDKGKMTERVLKGLSNPVARIFAHPTGRLLNSREGYSLDWERIFRFCLENDKALEINCFPNRLDLPDTLVREAVERGVLLSLGTDSHNASSMELLPYGIAVARRGWATKENIINTWSYNKIIKWLRKRPG